MDLHPVGLIRSLQDELGGVLPAHETLGSMTAAYADDDRFADRARGDYVFVQGRGDRLHLFLCVDDPASAGPLETFQESDGNWRWIVTWDEHESAVQNRIEGLPFGLLVAGRAGGLRKVSDAAPNPGIFIKAYPALRKEWRKLASW